MPKLGFGGYNHQNPRKTSLTSYNLPSQTLSTEHGKLQKLWHNFIKEERELAINSYPVTTKMLCKRSPKQKAPRSQSKDPGSTPETTNNREVDELGHQTTTELQSVTPTNLHIHASDEIVLKFTNGYKGDKDFALLISCTLGELQDTRKHRAY